MVIRNICCRACLLKARQVVLERVNVSGFEEARGERAMLPEAAQRSVQGSTEGGQHGL